MKRFLYILMLLFILITVISISSSGQDSIPQIVSFPESSQQIDEGIHQFIKTKFIEGSALFMSSIALCLIIGLSFCLERIIYLNLAQINSKKFLSEIERKMNENAVDEAKEIARNTRGPVASICFQAISRINGSIEEIDKSITATGSVQTGLLEKNLSWISLFIAISPSIGFLGTVVGMVIAFEDIQQYGDITPTIIAGGMKIALITTVGGLIVAIMLQLFYNYILSKIEGIVNEMENDSITILDIISQFKRRSAK